MTWVCTIEESRLDNNAEIVGTYKTLLKQLGLKKWSHILPPLSERSFPIAQK